MAWCFSIYVRVKQGLRTGLQLVKFLQRASLEPGSSLALRQKSKVKRQKTLSTPTLAQDFNFNTITRHACVTWSIQTGHLIHMFPFLFSCSLSVSIPKFTLTWEYKLVDRSFWKHQNVSISLPRMDYIFSLLTTIVSKLVDKTTHRTQFKHSFASRVNLHQVSILRMRRKVKTTVDSNSLFMPKNHHPSFGQLFKFVR